MYATKTINRPKLNDIRIVDIASNPINGKERYKTEKVSIVVIINDF